MEPTIKLEQQPNHLINEVKYKLFVGGFLENDKGFLMAFNHNLLQDIRESYSPEDFALFSSQIESFTKEFLVYIKGNIN